MKRWLMTTAFAFGILSAFCDSTSAAWIHYGPIGWGSPSVGRGGAEVAVGDTCMALTVNLQEL